MRGDKCGEHSNPLSQMTDQEKKELKRSMSSRAIEMDTSSGRMKRRGIVDVGPKWIQKILKWLFTSKLAEYYRGGSE